MISTHAAIRHQDPYPQFPRELKSVDRWVCWRMEAREKGLTKVPVSAINGMSASSTNAETWSTYGKAVVAHLSRQYNTNGLGFVFVKDAEIVGVDLDKCRDPQTGELEAWAQDIVTRLDSYTEVSPSGRGVHIFLRAGMPQNGNRKGRVEIYGDGRYFTVTGNMIGCRGGIEDRQAQLDAVHAEHVARPEAKPIKPAPVQPVDLDDHSLIQRAQEAKNGSEFRLLWSGDWQGAGFSSQSEADLSLCNKLAFWTGRDAGRMDRLFRGSGLFRDKWERGDYREETITKAISGTSEVYRPGSFSEAPMNGTNHLPSVASPQPQPWDPSIPFPIHESPIFPVATLPEWWRDWVAAEAEFTQTPVDLAAMASLATLAAACAKKAVVVPRDGWIEHLNLWPVVAAGSGEKKSPVFKAATEPLSQHEEQWAKDYSNTFAVQTTRYDIKQKSLHKAKEEAAKPGLEDVERQSREAEAERIARDFNSMRKPVKLRLMADDITSESLASVLAEHGGKIAILSAEGGFFSTLAGRYSDGVPCLDVALKGYTGETIMVDRVGRPSECVKSPALTMGFAVQPAVLREAFDNKPFRERGLLARFLYSIPKSLVGTRRSNPPSVPESIASRYLGNVLKILSLQEAQDERGEGIPTRIVLDDVCLAQLSDYTDEIEKRMREGEDLDSMRDWANKLVGQTLRVAGLLHIAEHVPATGSIPATLGFETLCRAMELGEYFLAQAKIVFFGIMDSDPVMKLVRRVWAWIKRKEKKRASRHEIYLAMHTSGHIKDSTELDAPIALLENNGFLRKEVQQEPRGPGRPPGPSFEVNPKADELMATVQSTETD